MQSRLHRSHVRANNLRDFLERDALIFEKDQGFPLKQWQGSHGSGDRGRHLDSSPGVRRSQVFRFRDLSFGQVFVILLQGQIARDRKQVYFHTSAGRIITMRSPKYGEEALLSEVLSHGRPTGQAVREAVDGTVVKIESLLRRHRFPAYPLLPPERFQDTAKKCSARSGKKRGTLNAMSGLGQNPEASVRTRLIGVWKLLSFEVSVDGNVLHPYGEHPIGRLTYDEVGRMSAHVMKPGRKSSVNDPEAVADASCDELRQIADGYLGYYGTFTVDVAGETVIHHVESCTLPAWVGTAQARQYEFVGVRLVLRAGSGKLVWERLPS
jgi:hypothetical protein